MIEINDTTYAEFIKAPIAVITFSSPWCSSCKKIASSLDSFSHRVQDRVSFGICDISACPSIPSSLQVLSLPTVIIFKEGSAVKRLQGTFSEASVVDALKEFL